MLEEHGGPHTAGVPQVHTAGGHSIVRGCTLSFTALRMLTESGKNRWSYVRLWSWVREGRRLRSVDAAQLLILRGTQFEQDQSITSSESL